MTIIGLEWTNGTNWLLNITSLVEIRLTLTLLTPSVMFSDIVLVGLPASISGIVRVVDNEIELLTTILIALTILKESKLETSSYCSGLI
jgi:hypothetical protein